jgi:hypothetical protein
MFREFADQWAHLDSSYFTKLVDAAIKNVEKFGSFQDFVS